MIDSLMDRYHASVQDPSVYKASPDAIHQWTEEGFEMAKLLYDGLEEYKAVP